MLEFAYIIHFLVPINELSRGQDSRVAISLPSSSFRFISTFGLAVFNSAQIEYTPSLNEKYLLI